MASGRTHVFGDRLRIPLLLAAVLAAAPAHGQDTDLAFGDVIDVHLVNVEVWVRDPKGNPVTGLTAEDFVVFEDGKRVEVTHFSELRGGAGAPATALERLPIPEEEPAEEAAAGEGDGAGHLVLYLDDLHLGSLSRKDVVEDLRAFVAAGSVPPERVMVLRQTENLSTEAMFGATAADLEAALTRLGAPSPESVQAERDKRLALDRLSQLWDQARNRISTGPSDISTQVCPWYIRSTKIEVDAFARRARTRIETTLEHLSTVSRILAGVAGVKTLVYVADSLEMKPGTDLLAFVYGICPRAEQGDRDYFQTEELGDEFRRFTRHANANRVTFYTLQALGLRSSRFFGADQTAIATIPKGFDVQQRANEREGLTFLAQQTGGRTVFNRGQYTGELERIADDMGTYYWLAYAPPHGGDGFEHRIGVKVTDVPPFATEKKRLEVRHRLGYRDKSADERMAERLQSALYLGEVSNPLAARLGSGDLSDAGKGAFTVPFHVLVPVGSVVFLPHSGGELANLKLQVASREVGTGRVTREEKLFRVERPPQGSSELVDLLVDLRLETGVHVLAVGLRDEATQETSYLTTAIRIQDPAKAGS